MPISAEQLAANRAEVTVQWNDEEALVEYKVDAITREFRAEMLRLSREAARLTQRQKVLLERVNTVSDTEDAAEDEAAEKAIQQILADDDEIKHRIDRLLIAAVSKWDVPRKDGSMLPLTEEALFPISASFEKVVIQTISEHATLGEANAPNSSISSPSPLKQKARQAIGRQSQSYTRISRRVSGARR